MKNFFIKSLAIINFAEGFIHIIGSAISFYGMYDANVWDWRIAAAPTADVFLGAASLVTGFVLNKWGCSQVCQD